MVGWALVCAVISYCAMAKGHCTPLDGIYRADILGQAGLGNVGQNSLPNLRLLLLMLFCCL